MFFRYYISPNQILSFLNRRKVKILEHSLNLSEKDGQTQFPHNFLKENTISLTISRKIAEISQESEVKSVKYDHMKRHRYKTQTIVILLSHTFIS